MSRARLFDYLAAGLLLATMVGPALANWLTADGFPRTADNVTHAVAFALAMRLWWTRASGGASIPPPPLSSDDSDKGGTV